MNSSPSNIRNRLQALEVEENIISNLFESSNSNSALILCKNFESHQINFIEEYIPQQIFPKVEKDHLPCFPETCNTLNISSEWNSLLDRISSTSRVLLCGGKSVGKSTLLRFLINKLISQYSEVVVIDLDPGQSEFTIPGCVAITHVRGPLLGPNYTHLLTPRRCIFVPNINVGHNPFEYLKCVQQLLVKCTSFDVPTIVNYMGFTRSFGLDIFASVMTLVQPTIVTDIRSSSPQKIFPEELNWEKITERTKLFSSNSAHISPYEYLVIKSMADSNQGWHLQPRQLREMSILSYFSQVLPNDLLSLTDGQVPVHVINLSMVEIVDNKETVDYSVANASLVALCSLPEDSTCYNCYGWGTVRGIDLETQELFLITPLPIDILELVDHLVIGSVNIPPSLLMAPCDNIGLVPYISEKVLTTSGQIRQANVPILPPNLTLHPKAVLNGVYHLQLMNVVEISRPKLLQLQILRNSHTVTKGDFDNKANETGKRMLQLTLTDGVQEIQAIEYKTITCLNVNLTPGVIVKIVGPVTLRRGQIMLETDNIEVIGGEVENMIIENSAENMLARALNKPENTNPSILEEVPEDTSVPLTTAITTNLNRNTHGGTDTVNQNLNPLPTPSGSSAVSNSNLSRTRNQIQPSTSHTIPSTAFINEDEETRIAAEIDMLLEAEQDLEIQTHTGRELHSKQNIGMYGKKRRCESPDIFDDSDCSSKQLMNVKQIITTPRRDKNIVNHNDNNKSFGSESSKSFFDAIDIDTHLDMIDAEMKKAKESCNKDGTILIKDLITKRCNITSGKFKINARFNRVIEKLTANDNAWSIKLCISDDTGEFVAWLDSSITSNLIGYDTSAIPELRTKILMRDECTTAAVLKAIADFKRKVTEFCGVMELTFKQNERDPTITRLLND